MKPVYKFPKERFYPKAKGIILDIKQRKRFFLEVELKNRTGKVRWLVILKNPSRACEEGIEFSDKTVNTVCEYFYQNKTDVSTIVIMNLFPVYETYSKELINRRDDLVDEQNKGLLKKEIKKANGIVLAWGKHPDNCKKEFDDMKEFIYPLLKNKNCYQMAKWVKNDFISNLKRPLHGQVWGYNESKYCLKKVYY